MKGEVLEKLENLKEIDQKAYCGLVDKAAQRYRRVERVSACELRLLIDELKGAWAQISKQLI